MDASVLLTSSLVAAVVSFALTQAHLWQSSGRKSRALLRGILLEIDYAEECATSYIKDSSSKLVWSPAYRASIEFLRSGIPVLAENGHLKDDGVKALYTLYLAATDANRSLDELAVLLRQPDQDAVVQRDAPLRLYPKNNTASAETSRARAKFEHVLNAVPSSRLSASRALEALRWFESS